MTAHDPPPSPQASSKLSGRLWVLAAALMWSSCGLIVKAGFFEDWPPSVQGPLLAFWRSFFAGLVLVPLVRRPRFNLYLVPLVVCFAIMCVTYLTAMARTTAANAVWLQATAPWWVLILSVSIFREPVVRRDLVPLGFGVLGVAFILLFEFGIQAQDRFAVACGIGSGITYGCVIIFMRRLSHQNPAWLLALAHVVTTLVMLPWMLHLGIWPSWAQLAVLAGFGVFQMAIPYICLIRGLRSISSQEAVAIALLEPVLTPLWVFLAGLETPEWWTVAGAALIFAGLVLRYVILELFWPKD